MADLFANYPPETDGSRRKREIFDCWQRQLKRTPAIVMDGGFSNSLQLVDPSIDLTTSLWSALAVASHPDAVKEVHRRFLRAGSRFLTASASYQALKASFHSVLPSASPEEVEQLMQVSLRPTNLNQILLLQNYMHLLKQIQHFFFSFHDSIVEYSEVGI
jgi:hypothetical protein